MKITDLISYLEEALDSCGDLEVKVAIQPNYPLAENIVAICSPDDYGCDDDEDGDDDSEPILWLATEQDRRNPYGVPSDAWDNRVW